MKVLTLACLVILTASQSVLGDSLISVKLDDVRWRIGENRNDKYLGAVVAGIDKVVINGEKYDPRFSVKELSETLSRKLDIPLSFQVNQVILASKYEDRKYVERSQGSYMINSVSQFWFDKDVLPSYKEITKKRVHDAKLLPHEPLSAASLNCLSKQIKEVNSALINLKETGDQPEKVVIHIFDANSCEVNVKISEGLTCKEQMAKAGFNSLQIKSYVDQMKTLDLLDENKEKEKAVVRVSIDPSGICEVTSKDDLKKILTIQNSQNNSDEQKRLEENKDKAYNELMDITQN